MSVPPPPPESVALLDQLLASLFDDFETWFRRGLVLLDCAPESLLPAAEREQLRSELSEGLASLAATRALRRASPTPMAVDMDAMTPWHRLMMRVWSLSSQLRGAGVPLPDQDSP